MDVGGGGDSRRRRARAAYHLQCLSPPVYEFPPESAAWLCPVCEAYELSPSELAVARAYVTQECNTAAARRSAEEGPGAEGAEEGEEEASEEAESEGAEGSGGDGGDDAPAAAGSGGESPSGGGGGAGGDEAASSGADM